MSIKLSQLVAAEFPQALLVQSSKEQRITDDIETLHNENKCAAITLFVLTVLFAAASAVLFALSGGPNNLLLFEPALVGTALTAVFMIASMIRGCQSCQGSEAMRSTWATQSDVNYDFSQVLDMMVDNKITQLRIGTLINGLQVEHQFAFVNLVYKRYFGPGAHPLTDVQKKIIRGLANTQVLKVKANELDADNKPINPFLGLDRQFALEILRGLNAVDPDPTNNKETTQLFYCLVKRIGTSQRSEECEAFARHPVAVAVLVQNHPQQFTEPEPYVAAIVNKMNVREKTTFLNKMVPVLPDAGSENPEQAQANKEKKKISVIIIAICLSAIVTPEIVAELKQKRPPFDSRDLFTALAQWPHMLAGIVHASEYNLWACQDFMQLVSNTVGKNVYYLETAEMLLLRDNHRQEAVNQIVTTLNNGFMPDLIRNLYPHLASLKNHVLSVPHLNQIGQACAATLWPS